MSEQENEKQAYARKHLEEHMREGGAMKTYMVYTDSGRYLGTVEADNAGEAASTASNTFGYATSVLDVYAREDFLRTVPADETITRKGRKGRKR